MAWVQNAVPPRNERIEFTIADFSGGLNNRANIIAPNEASDILNMAFLYDDIMEKRNGFKPYDSVTLSDAVTYMGLYQPYTDDDQLVRASDKEVYADEKKIASVLGEIDGVNYQGMFLFTDGESLHAYGKHTEVTGTYVEVVGTHPKDYVSLRVINPPEGYEPLEEHHQRGKTVYNYDEMTVHYEPCVQELDDVYKGANLLPEHPRYIESHKGRLFVSGDRKDDDNVFITDVSNPFYFAVSLPIQLPPNSDKVTGMTVWDDAIIIGRARDMYRIIGETSNPELGFSLFELRRINSHTGVANNKSFTRVHSYLFFLGSDGTVYALSTTHMDNRLVATQIISQTLDLFKTPINATTDDIKNSSAVFDGEFWYLNLGERTLVYSYRHRAWTMYDYVDMNAPFMLFETLVWGRKDGRVVAFGDTYMDDGRPIYAFWESMAFDMEAPSRYKQFREFYLVAKAYDDMDTNIRLTFEIDYADVRSANVVENHISIWGISKFGDRFADRNIKSSIPTMIGRRARMMRIRIENGYRVDNWVDTYDDVLGIPRKQNYMGVYIDDESQFRYYLNGQWIALSDTEINEPMLVYQINGEYEMKGKR